MNVFSGASKAFFSMAMSIDLSILLARFLKVAPRLKSRIARIRGGNTMKLEIKPTPICKDLNAKNIHFFCAVSFFFFFFSNSLTSIGSKLSSPREKNPSLILPGSVP